MASGALARQGLRHRLLEASLIAGSNSTAWPPAASRYPGYRSPRPGSRSPSPRGEPARNSHPGRRREQDIGPAQPSALGGVADRASEDNHLVVRAKQLEFGALGTVADHHERHWSPPRALCSSTACTRTRYPYVLRDAQRTRARSRRRARAARRRASFRTRDRAPGTDADGAANGERGDSLTDIRDVQMSRATTSERFGSR